MTTTVSVGRFATMTHLSVKTLRHYHQVGFLEPAEVDRHTGYRFYSLEQLPTAQLIRQLRDLQMPVAGVHAVLVARSAGERDTLIAVFPVLAITEDTVDPADIETWWRDALYELRSAADEHGMKVTGPAGALYDECLFEREPGQRIGQLHP